MALALVTCWETVLFVHSRPTKRVLQGAADMEDTPTADYPQLMQPRTTQPKARPFRVVASERCTVICTLDIDLSARCTVIPRRGTPFDMVKASMPPAREAGRTVVSERGTVWARRARHGRGRHLLSPRGERPPPVRPP